jgi:rRNA-processing protein FCF1
MCILIDANAIHDMMNDKDAARPVLRWLHYGKRSGLVVGGRLLQEWKKARFDAILIQLSRAGRLHRVPDNEVSVKEQEFASRKIKSDDPHILALVDITSCPVVFTRDKNLHRDLKDRSLIQRKPSIYQSSDHEGLLGECDCGG